MLDMKVTVIYNMLEWQSVSINVCCSHTNMAKPSCGGDAKPRDLQKSARLQLIDDYSSRLQLFFMSLHCNRSISSDGSKLCV